MQKSIWSDVRYVDVLRDKYQANINGHAFNLQLM